MDAVGLNWVGRVCFSWRVIAVRVGLDPLIWSPLTAHLSQAGADLVLDLSVGPGAALRAVEKDREGDLPPILRIGVTGQ